MPLTNSTQLGGNEVKEESRVLFFDSESVITDLRLVSRRLAEATTGLMCESSRIDLVADLVNHMIVKYEEALRAH